MPAIGFLFAGRFDKLRTGTPRSYKRGTRVNRRSKKQNPPFGGFVFWRKRSTDFKYRK